MTRRLLPSSFLTLVLLAIPTALSAQSQSGTGRHASGIGVLLVKPKDPVYPQIARIAHVDGDVRVLIRIRKDGTVDSVDYVSGPPLLKKAAVDSAMNSVFECDGCTEAITPYPLVYTFQFSDGDCCNAQSGPAEVSESQHHIWVTTAPFCFCDPGATIGKRVRSIKCLYLWRCGSRPG